MNLECLLNLQIKKKKYTVTLNHVKSHFNYYYTSDTVAICGNLTCRIAFQICWETRPSLFRCKHIKGIVHFEIKIWYLSAYPKGIQDVGVFFSSVDPILMFLGQTVLVCQSYNGRYRSLSL